MTLRGAVLAGLGLAALTPAFLAAQGYRLRIDSRVQRVAYRGVAVDSVASGSVVTGPTGGLETPNGFAVSCRPGAQFCHFFRPGSIRRGGPYVTTGDLTLWGIGVTGLSFRTLGRLGLNLGDSDVWPGTDPSLQLLEAYAEYGRPAVTARLGRQTRATRLGISGFDGGHATVRDVARGFELTAFAGWGLARGVPLPVTSPALNPLDDFQPQRRQIVAGGSLAWQARYTDVRLDYEREVDPRSDYFVSERTALSASVRPLPRWSLETGAEYDLAQGWWGTADLTLRYAAPVLTALFGARRYRPHFELWTIWGAFSPVPYEALTGSVWVSPLAGLQLRARGERFWFDDTETETPLVSVEEDGWRVGVGGTYTVGSRWTFDVGYHRELGPGAASAGLEGSVTYLPDDRWSLTVHGATLTRPLEFRFDEAGVVTYGLDAEFTPSARLRVGVSASGFEEERRRPDAAAFDWNQTRLSAYVTLVFGSAADRSPLPPAVRRPPRRARQ